MIVSNTRRTMPAAGNVEYAEVEGFEEGDFTFPDSTVTIMPKKETDEGIVYVGYLTAKGKNTGKVFYSFTYRTSEDYTCVLDEKKSGGKNYKALVGDGDCEAQITEAIEQAIILQKQDDLDGQEGSSDEEEEPPTIKKTPNPRRSAQLAIIKTSPQPKSSGKKRKANDELTLEAQKIAGLGSKITALEKKLNDKNDTSTDLEDKMDTYKMNLESVAKGNKSYSKQINKVLDALTVIQEARDVWSDYKYTAQNKNGDDVDRMCLTDLTEILKIKAKYLQTVNRDVLVQQYAELVKEHSDRSRSLQNRKDRARLENIGFSNSDIKKLGLHVFPGSD